ncbi:MAG: poly-gamma-glutamate hydrolase family protein [Cyanobacteria bacterium J06623_7]
MCEVALEDSQECQLGKTKDYELNIDREGEDVVVLSIHGGLIEPYTSQVSADVAQRFTWKRYDFEAHARPQCSGYDGSVVGKINQANFRNLHITSSRFNEKQALKLVRSNPQTVSIHGYSPSRQYDKGLICVGGRNVERNTQVKNFIHYIKKNRENLDLVAKDARSAKRGEDCGAVGSRPRLSGSLKKNIVNQNSNHAGLQLEFNYQMLESLGDRSSADYEKYDAHRTLIYDAIKYAINNFPPVEE